MGTHDQFRTKSFDHDSFVQANTHLVEKMTHDGLFVLYDDVLDTLFIDVGSHRDGVLEPAVDNVSIRFDPETLELLGYEIEDFRQDFLPHHRLVAGLVEEVRLFQRPNERINASESTQEETLRRLVAVA